MKDINDKKLIKSSKSSSDFRQSDYFNLTLTSTIQRRIHLQ